MPFKSTEIRWFSAHKNSLWSVFSALPKGEVEGPAERTDYYLRLNSRHTGIKIREGNHEIKVKWLHDETLDIGQLQHWIKWSTPEDMNILNAIPRELMVDWIAVHKKRRLIKYQLTGQNQFLPVEEDIEEGCEAEFTEIRLGPEQKILYTLGFEAFSAKGESRSILLTILRGFKLELERLGPCDSYGYPELLSRLAS